MNLDKIQLVLDKINRLHKSMSLDPENVAQIEKDLMKDYVKLLYGACLDDHTPSIPRKIERKENFEPSFEASTPIVTQRRSIERQSTPNPTPTPKRVEYVPPVERIIAPPPVAKPVVEEVVAETPPPVYQPHVTAARSNKNTDIPKEYSSLFHQEEGKELSHKLSSLPISDLHKAMGINERIFTINELFRGDSMAFKHTMTSLNQLSSFEEAKNYLAQNVAGEFDWVNKSKINKAKNFIRLVKRRYI